MLVGDVEYARTGEYLIAYQVVGDGSVDVVFAHGFGVGFDGGWDEPLVAAFYKLLARGRRLILFDARGTGLSDSVANDALPDLEARIDDMRAVMDSADCRQAALFGVANSAAECMLYAATYPARTLALILHAPDVREARAPDWPWGWTESDYETAWRELREHGWRRDFALEFLRLVAPSVASDSRIQDWWVRMYRRTISPSATIAWDQMRKQTDVRGIVPTVSTPALIVRPCDCDEGFRHAAEYVADRISGAQLAVVDGADLAPWAPKTTF